MSINYNNNIWIGNLFPSTCKDMGIEDNCYNRILKYLGEDNLYWALVFCFTVYNKENYIDIKKALNKIRLDILTDYHEILQKNLENLNPDTDFISLIQFIDTLRTTVLGCSYREARKQIEEIMKLAKAEDQEKAYYRLYSELEKGNHSIINSVIQEVNTIIKKNKILSPELEEVYTLEIQKITEYTLKDINTVYNRYKRREDYNKNLPINGYKLDSKYKLYHQSRRDLHREGKALLKRR